MDPNELLDELRALAEDVFDNGEDPLVLADALATKLTELDDHLSKGGELPEDWDH